MSKELEEGTCLQLNFDRFKTPTGTGVVPVCVQDAATQKVLLVGFASAAALKYSLEHKVAALWSFSRDELWVKGLTSGNVFELIEVRINCEQNSLLYLVRPKGGGACHTKDAAGQWRETCYYRRIAANQTLEFVKD